jgi:predicted MFS family arabinose efflux permease
MAGALIGGRLADRLGTKFMTGASLAGLCGGFLLLRLALSGGVFVELALGLSSAAAQLFFPAQQAGLARDFPEQSATVLAWNNSALFLGIALGSLIGGRAAAIGGFDETLATSAVIALAGCVINGIVVPLTGEPELQRRNRGLSSCSASLRQSVVHWLKQMAHGGGRVWPR